MASQVFSTRETAVVVTFAIVAGCVPALQPMLLGGLLADGKISAAAIGYAATTECLGMALASAYASAFLPPRRLRVVTALAILAALAANALTVLLPAAGIVAARALSGLGNGVLLWVLVGMMTRSQVPTRLFAIYVTAQALISFVLSLTFATYAIPHFGVLAGYLVLFALNLLLLPALALVPREYVDLDESDGKVVLPPPLGWLGLGTIVLQLAGVMAFWVYSLPLGIQSGVGSGSIRMIVSAANGVQIIAGFAAIALAGRVSGVQAVIATAIASATAMLVTIMGGSVALWLPALLIFAFCWMFAPPFHIAFLITADSSGRAAMFVSTAQLVGMAVGPLIASLVTNTTNYGPARLVSIACFVAVVVLATVIYRQATREQGGAPLG